MKQSYPELETGFDRIAQIAYAEEEAFRRTLAAGTTILDTAVARDQAGRRRDARRATRRSSCTTPTASRSTSPSRWRPSRASQVDREGFRAPHAASSASGPRPTRRRRRPATRTPRCGATCGRTGATEFLAYEELASEATVLGLRRRRRGRSPRSSRASAARSCSTGRRSTRSPAARSPTRASSPPTASQLRSLDVQRPVKGLIAHTRRGASRARCAPARRCCAEVDPEWRLSACQAHSGTHVVHAALRQVLGPSALQSGSYNKPGYLRLDFAWGQALSAGDPQRDRGGRQPRGAQGPAGVGARTCRCRRPGRSARWRCSARPTTRTCASSRSAARGRRELCGGTHVQHSSQIGALTVTGESSVGSGVRRVEAFVGIDALRYLARERAIVAELTGLVGCAAGRARRAGRRHGRRGSATPSASSSAPAASRCRPPPATSPSRPATSTA